MNQGIRKIPRTLRIPRRLRNNPPEEPPGRKKPNKILPKGYLRNLTNLRNPRNLRNLKRHPRNLLMPKPNLRLKLRLKLKLERKLQRRVEKNPPDLLRQFPKGRKILKVGMPFPCRPLWNGKSPERRILRI
jgi:hypothetical protein